MTLILLFLQILIMSSARISIIPITFYLHSIYTLTVGLYSKNSIWLLLAHGLFTILADIAYIVFIFMDKYQLMPFHYYTNHIYVLILVLLLAITVISRIVMIVLYFKFRNAYQESNGQIYYFHAFKQEFRLLPVSDYRRNWSKVNSMDGN